MVCRLSQVSVFVCGSHFNVCDYCLGLCLLGICSHIFIFGLIDYKMLITVNLLGLDGSILHNLLAA